MKKAAFQELYSAKKNLLNMRVSQHLFVALFRQFDSNPLKTSRKFVLSRYSQSCPMPGKFWKKFATQ